MKCFIKTWSVERGAWSEKRLAVVLFTLYASLSTAAACPFCSDNVANGMAKGFFWRILLMLGVPVAVVATIAVVIWRASQKKDGLPDAPRG